MSDDVLLIVDSDLNGGSPQFTLTCISTGGPATTVTWTRDSVTVTEGTETVLNDREEAEYTHTLTVTGSIDGSYTCFVANNKPSFAMKSYLMAGKTVPYVLIMQTQAVGTLQVSTIISLSMLI